MEGTLVLPTDVKFIPAKELAADTREKIGASEEDIAVTRPRSRAPSKVIDADTYALLKQFEQPTTIVKAILHFSKQRKLDAQTVLDEAFPMLQSFFESKLLVDPESADAHTVEATYSTGAEVAEVTIEETLALISDTELYRVRTAGGSQAVLKLARSEERQIRYLLHREAKILDRAASSGVTPRLLAQGGVEGKPYLLMEYCPGEDLATAAIHARNEGPESVLRLCVRVIESYARLHAAGIVHGDVHPGNVKVDGERVWLLDFGVSIASGAKDDTGAAPRAGIGFFFEPEYASAVAASTAPPLASIEGEQYAVAAMCYYLIAGVHYIEFPGEKHEMMRAIATAVPMPFSTRKAVVPEGIERVLFQALSKDRAHRFASTAEFLTAFGAALQGAATMLRAHTPEAAMSAKLRSVLGELDEPRTKFDYRGPASPTVSVTYGGAGIAYMLYRLASLREDAKLLALADRWAVHCAQHLADEHAFHHPEVQIDEKTVGAISPYHSASGVHLVESLIAAARADELSLGLSLDSYLAAIEAPCEKIDLTLGQFSTVIGSALLLDALGESAARQPLIDAGQRHFGNAWQRIEALGPIATCREEQYLGLAHGWAGFLYTALRWSLAGNTPLPESVPPRLRELAALGEEHGKGMRWPFHLGAQAGSRHMPGWCNGTAGFVLLWTLAYRVLREEWLLKLAERAAIECAAAPGGLHSLCCGAAGQAYALLAMHNLTGDGQWFDAARRKTVEGVRLAERPTGEDLPFSLYKGDVGLALLCAELERPEIASMPFC